MQRDSRDLPITASSAAAASAFDHALEGYFKYRADTADRLAAALALDPAMPMAHLLRGYFAMLSYKLANVATARDARDAAARAMGAGGTARERSHLHALDAWIGGLPERAIHIWEQHLAGMPHDLLAFRLSHFLTFWSGRPDLMLASCERTMPRWSQDLPGFGTVLACHAFALEECGRHTEAEIQGREALAFDAADLWATHAVAHVMEMQARRREGIAWLEQREAHWTGGNNLLHHLWWHRALFHYEEGEFDAALSIYDRQFRNPASPLMRAQPDLYIDVQNAVAMLYRLQRLGVDVGGRWRELADHAEARIGDDLSAFTVPHWALALAADGRDEACRRFVAALADAAAPATRHNRLVAEVARPIAEGFIAHMQGRHSEAVSLMLPVLGQAGRLGGSHAQQDLIEQVFIFAAAGAGRRDLVRLSLQRQAGRFPTPPERRIAYRALADGKAF